jgi:hypothetical protein
MEAGKERGRGDDGARAAFWLAWSLWTLSLASAVVSAVFRFLNVGTPTAVSQEPLVFDLWFLLVSLSFATVGALVASRQPKNAIGWIFCALGVCNTLAAANQGYAIYALLTLPVHLPGGRKYDARKTLDAFSAKLRNETDLDSLNADLLSVVRETMQPEYVSHWLKPTGDPSHHRSKVAGETVE